METSSALQSEVLRLWLVGKPFLLGMAYLGLAAIQQTNTFYRRARLAFFTSLLIGGCAFAQMNYVARGNIAQFLLFQLGCACGSVVGIKVGHALRRDSH